MTYHPSNHFYGDISNLNAPYDNISVQGLGIVTWEGKTLPAVGYPWRGLSEDTLKVQAQFNPELAKMDLCPLLLDGDLGPRTCGALFTLPNSVPAPSGLVATCSQHVGEAMEPKHCAGGVPPAPPAPEPVPVVTKPKSAGMPVWVWGVGLGALAIGAAVAMKKKRR